MSPQPMRRRTLLSALAAGAAAATTGVALPAQAQGKHCRAAKTGPVTVAYIEVNDHSMLSAGKYTLANGGAQVIDVAVIFAANINYDGSNAYLSFNQQVQSVLDNVATQVRPLQQKGIKVLLSILGNHQGAGFANFPTQAAADAFAQQLADTVNQYGLDGIDFDDEYAEYGNNGTGQPNDFSFVYLVQALRAKLPNKLITLYDIGPAADRLTYNGQSIANTFDYAWNPYYGTWGVPSGPTSKSRLSPAAVSYTATSSSTAASLAQRTVSEGYGVFLTYNLTESDTLVVHDRLHPEALRQRDGLHALVATGWPAARSRPSFQSATLTAAAALATTAPVGQYLRRVCPAGIPGDVVCRRFLALLIELADYLSEEPGLLLHHFAGHIVLRLVAVGAKAPGHRHLQYDS